LESDDATELKDKLDEKLEHREARYDYERRFRKKWSENTRTLEEVFDRRTIMTILRILNTGRLKEITGVVKAGKESRVYHGLDHDGTEVAVKIFLTTSAIFRQGRLKYFQGDPRFKNLPHDTTSLVDQWALKEFWNLKLAEQAGVNVPSPLYHEKNVVLLSFIGMDGVPAPLLREVSLEKPREWYKKIMEMLKTLHDRAKLVHGDVSEYNIMVPDGYPVLIDFGQAVQTEHPEANVFLERDVQNLNNYFKGLGCRTSSFKTLFG
jgi:RIO kinase 1